MALKCLSAGLLDLWRSLGQRTVSREREGPWAGAHPLFRVFFLLQPGLLCLRSFFFNQSSFFGLVRPGWQCERGDAGDVVRGPLQELTLGRLALVGVPTDGGDHGHHDGGDHHRWPRLATPAHVLGAAATSSALRRRARPWEGAHRHRRLPLAIFCDQVFFDYDPSSSTSLLSSAMGQTKAKNRNGNGGDWSETVAMLDWRRTKEHGGTRDSSTSFLDKLKLDSEGDCSFKPEISFLGVDFSKKLKSWSPW